MSINLLVLHTAVSVFHRKYDILDNGIPRNTLYIKIAKIYDISKNNIHQRTKDDRPLVFV